MGDSAEKISKDDQPDQKQALGQRLSNLKIGMEELSFIKKDAGNNDSFMDSFTLIDQGKKDQPDINLLDDDPMALYNDIIEEEFDLDEEMDQVHNLRSPESFDRGTLNEDQAQL